MEPAETVRAYYRALDAGDYDALRGLLAEGFVQRRPDRRFDGRAAFVRFMRDERPRTDTTHDLAGVYRPVGDDGTADGTDPGALAERVARGRLVGDEGAELFAFVDVFRVADGELVELRTYTG